MAGAHRGAQLALRIKQEKGARGWGSTQKERLRCNVRRGVHVWQVCQGSHLERFTRMGLVGSAGDWALQLGLIWSQPCLEKVHPAGKTAERDSGGWSPRGQVGPEWG